MTSQPCIHGIFAFMKKIDGKMRIKGVILLSVSLLGFSAMSIAQEELPVTWSFDLTQSENETYTFRANAEIEKGWHVYTLNPYDDPEAFGPNPTELNLDFTSANGYLGSSSEMPGSHTDFDVIFEMDLRSYSHECWFDLTFDPKEASSPLIASLSYQACDSGKCIFPNPLYFEIDVEANPASFRMLKAEETLAWENEKSAARQGREAAEEVAANSSVFDPVKWEFSSYKDGENYLVLFQATVEEGWHIYSQHINGQDGPLPTMFTFTDKSLIKAPIVEECTPHVEYDPNFMMDLKFFEGTANWWLTVPAEDPRDLSGYLTYMVCDSTKCLPPEDVDFSFDLDASNDRPADIVLCEEEEEEEKESKSLWVMFFLGTGIGFAALLTPCVFPMIPMTVSFFTKQSKTRAQGIRNALIYGIFIIAIYTGVGLILSAIFGADVLYAIASHPIFNLFLFVLLVVFGLSFLGAFEIQLPTSWTNKADGASDRGGIIGIFFMAATLALVSFSCTGPLVGTALAGASQGDFAAPTVVMFGFSLALALPFGLFAMFPGWLNSLPQSGGWLNSVKVVLGLLEIGFAFKFLSNTDLSYQWHLLEREPFIAIWIAISLTITLYLFGKIRFPHDSSFEKISITRFMFGLFFLSFTIYVIPGLWGAPLKLVSGYPPPSFYAESPNGIGSDEGGHGDGGHGDGENVSTSNHVVAEYQNYDEGLAAAKEQNLPLLVDFTGWTCVNCRRMEENIWTDSLIKPILLEDVVLVSLYVDDRTDLPESEQRIGEYGSKEYPISRLGQKWLFMQLERYDTNAQPLYAMHDHDGSDLIEQTASYDGDPAIFERFLKDGIAAFNKKHGE